MTRKQKDRLAAASPKWSMFWSVNSGSCFLPLPAPTEIAENPRATGKERKRGRKRRIRLRAEARERRDVVNISEPDTITAGEESYKIGS